MKYLLFILFFTAIQLNKLSAAEIFADSHIHYNWDHREETSTQEVVDILKKHNVGIKCATITPDEQRVEEFDLIFSITRKYQQGKANKCRRFQ